MSKPTETPEHQAKKQRATLELNAICPECGESLDIFDLNEGRNDGRVVKCDFDETPVEIPVILVKKTGENV